MRVLFLGILIALGLLGCSRKDPFDRVMDHVSHETVLSYPFVPIKLPATTTPEELISALKVRGVFQREQITSIKIMQVRSVHTSPPSVPEEYTAVLLDTDAGQKVVLFRPLKSETGMEEWYWKIYDAK
jgi:hypothetical protein